MCSGRCGFLIFYAGSENAFVISKHGNHPWLVDGDPIGYPVTEVFNQDSGVISEILGRLTVCPASLVFKHLWQVPVKQGRERLDFDFEQFINQAVVKLKPLRVYHTGSSR